uniref:Bursicon n=1 Tax=Plectus sambesii TaxID=2011161 RepID=A0A914WWK2_9BILA
MIAKIAKLLIRFPGYIFVTTGLLCSFLTAVPFIFTDLPDFSNPTLGFETRGTGISATAQAWRLLLKEVDVYNGRIFRYPRRLGKRSADGESANSPTSGDQRPAAFARGFSLPPAEPAFCPGATDRKNYAQLVFEVGAFESVETVRALCEVESKLFAMGLLSPQTGCDLAVTAEGRSMSAEDDSKLSRCCQPWHLGSVAAYISRRPTCSHLNLTNDWPAVWDLLNGCLPQRNLIIREWSTGSNQTLPLIGNLKRVNCSNQMLQILYENILPIDFPTGKTNFTLFILPYLKGGALIERGFDVGVVEQLPTLLSVPGARLVGMDLGLKEHVFSHYLHQDTHFGFLAAFLVVICVLCYTGSTLFTAAVIVNVYLSVGVAYFFYRIVFRLHFFPFINLLALVLLVGIGADDAFILHSAWLQAKRGPVEAPMAKLVEDSLRHACLSMFVTSLTTAAAFYTNIISKIIAIKCFSIFAGTTMLTNYLLVITWLPSSLVLIEKYRGVMANNCMPNFLSKVRHKVSLLASSMTETLTRTSSSTSNLYQLLPYTVTRMKFVYILAFTTWTTISCFAVVHTPGLKLPRQDFFQYLRSSHPFEKFEAEHRRQFQFLRQKTTFPLPIRIVWGVDAVDDWDVTDPRNQGTLNIWSADKFKMNETENFAWVEKFCDDLSRQNFIAGTNLPIAMHCTFSYFLSTFMKRPCHGEQNEDMRPCCVESKIPYESGVFDECIDRMVLETKEQFTGFYGSLGRSIGRPLFVTNADKTTRFGILIVSFVSKFNFSLSFAEMDLYYRTVHGWVDSEMSKGPAFIRDGFLASNELQFYDLHFALLNGTVISVVIAVFLAYLILLIIIQNGLVAFIAMSAITGVIVSTTGALVLLGWELNIVESTVIILTVGLSFDFTLHYAVAYGRAAGAQREERVKNAMGMVQCPIFMAFITTFVAGCAMLPVTTLAYYQIGLFMISSPATFAEMMKCESVVDLRSLPPCASCKSEAITGVALSSSTLHRSILKPLLFPRNRPSLTVIAVVILLLLLPCCNAAATRQGCHRVAVRRLIDEPGCGAVKVDVFRCAGRCLSFSFPSSDNVLGKNPEQKLTVRAKCCRMIDIKKISVELTCSDGQRSVDIPSAQECGCFDCGALV